MNDHLKNSAWLTGLVAVFAMALLWTANIQSPAAGSPAVFSTTRADPAARAHPVPAGYYVETKATVKYYDADHNFVSKDVFFGPDSKADAKTALASVVTTGDGGTSSFVGYGKMWIQKSMKSWIVKDTLAWVKVWVEWGWDNGIKDVSIHDKGRSEDNPDPTWHWDKWLSGIDTHYAWRTGYPRSGFEKMGKGQFHGPCISISITCQVWLKADLKVHSDGTYKWLTDGNDG